MERIRKRAAAKPKRLAKSTIARRGDAIYESKVKPLLKPRDRGKYVAIDVRSGDFEIRSDRLAAIDRLQARKPDAICWMVRIAAPFVTFFGGYRKTEPT